MSNQQLPTPAAPRYSGGQIAMLVIGSLMLLPGLCSILFVIQMLENIERVWLDPFTQMVMILWAVCFTISALGVALIVTARRRARRSS